jgi:DNA-binding CsgD family transcriptional regulator
MAADHASLLAAILPTDYEYAVVSAAMARAYLAAWQSNHQGVVAALAPVVAIKDRQAVDEPGVWPWQPLYSDALVALGRVAEADVFLRPHESLAAVRARRSMQARLARARGRLEAARGRRQAAETSFASALAHIDEIGMPFEQARIELAYGAFLRRTGRRLAAAEQLKAARSTFYQLRAEPYIDRCENELQACGIPSLGRRGRDRPRLTPQELSVARVVAGGLTNRQVASQLMLSTKTIEFHLGRIFEKLDIRSRADIAKRLEAG